MGAARQVKDRTTEVVDQLLADAPDATVILDADGRMVPVNTEAENMFGYCQEELLGQKPDLLMPKPRAERNVKRRPGQVARSKIRPFVHGLESVARHRDGTQFPIVIDLGLIEVGPGPLISGAIQKVQHKRREEYLQALVSASEDAIIACDIKCDIDGTILSWNKAAEKMYGYKAKEILGKSMSELVPPGRIDDFSEKIMGLLHGEPVRRFETERIHKDGHRIDIAPTISLVKSTDGKVLGASVVDRDITEQKNAQNTILSLRALVQASDCYRSCKNV
jgi:PAS domain S-box-containing protein